MKVKFLNFSGQQKLEPGTKYGTFGRRCASRSFWRGLEAKLLAHVEDVLKSQSLAKI